MRDLVPEGLDGFRFASGPDMGLHFAFCHTVVLLLASLAMIPTHVSIQCNHALMQTIARHDPCLNLCPVCDHEKPEHAVELCNAGCFATPSTAMYSDLAELKHTSA